MNIVYKVEINNKYYIGITSQGLQRRKKEHESRAKKGIKTHFYNALRQNNLNANWEIVFCSKEYNATKEVEKYYIKLYQTINPEYGYNHTLGGDGTVGFKYTQELIKKQSEIKKIVMNKPEVKEKLKLSRKKLLETENGKALCKKGGNFFKTEYGKKLARIRYKNTIEKIGHPRFKKVSISNKETGETINFRSIKDAAAYFNCSANTVSKYRNKIYKNWFIQI